MGANIGSYSDLDQAVFARRIKTFYDGIAREYDAERDAWTDHFNDSTQEFLRRVLDDCSPRRILDVGIGSGTQMLVYAAQGAELSGVDWSRGMLRVAAYKSVHEGIKVNLLASDAQALPFANATFDFVACCGSVLNYCSSPELALAELSRILRNKGRLVIGFDNRSTLDYLWILIDSITRHRTKYRIHIKDAVHWFSEPGPFVSYPYLTAEGRIDYVPERFLSLRYVSAVLASAGLRVARTVGVHILSSVIPFTLIARPKIDPWVVRFAGRLSSLDHLLTRLGGANWLADHILVEARRI